MATTLEKLVKYYEKEYKDVEELVANPPSWCKVEDSVQYAIQRCLGVAFFCQKFNDITFSEIDKEYESIRKDLENLIK